MPYGVEPSHVQSLRLRMSERHHWICSSVYMCFEAQDIQPYAVAFYIELNLRACTVSYPTAKQGRNRKAKDTKLLNLLNYSPRAYLIMSRCRKCCKDQKLGKSQEAPRNSYSRSSQMGSRPGHSLAHVSAPVMATVSTDSKKPTGERCETIILSRKKVLSAPSAPEPVTCSDITHPLQHSHPSTEYSDAPYLHNSNPGFFLVFYL